MEIQSKRIGVINNGIDGSDEYLLLTCLDQDLNPEQAKAWLLSQGYREGGGYGSYYCHSVLAVQGHSENQVIATVQHRFDV